MKSLLVTEDYNSLDSTDDIRVVYDKTTDLVWIDIPQPLCGFVDLGLPSGLKWASCNVGAEKPEDFGLYFAWGETEGYTGITSEKGFYWGDYKYSSGQTSSTSTIFKGLTKYNTKSSSGTVDN